MDVEAPQGYSMATATFTSPSGEYKISDIAVKSSGIIGVGNEYGQVVNQDGTWGTTYYYLTADNALSQVTGWYKDAVGLEAVTDKDVIKVGEAFFCSTSQPIIMTYSGEVVSGKPTIKCKKGYSMFGNPTPIAAKISDLEVEGTGIGVGNEYGQIVNPSGTWGTTYYYITAENALSQITGWYKDAVGLEAVTDEDILLPGECLFFSSGEDIEITFPAAL